MVALIQGAIFFPVFSLFLHIYEHIHLNCFQMKVYSSQVARDLHSHLFSSALILRLLLPSLGFVNQDSDASLTE